MKTGTRSFLYMMVIFSAGVWLVLSAGCAGEAAVVQITPEEAIRQAGEKLDAASTYRMEFDMHMDADGDLSGVEPEMAGMLPFSLGFTGQMDIDRSQDDEMSFRASGISFEGLNEMIARAGEASGADRTQSAMSAGMITQMTKDLEIMLVGDTMYFKFGGNWFRMAPEDMPEDSGIDLACLFSMQDDEPQTPAGDTEDLTEITELAAEDVDGVHLRHFEARLDPDKVDEDSGDEEAETCLTGSAADEKDERTAEEKKSDEEAFSRELAENAVVEFWVDDQLNLNRMRMVMEMDLADAARASGDYEAAEDMESVSIKIDFAIRFSALGEPLEITAPENPFPLKDLLDPLNSAGGGTRPGSRTRT